MSSTPQSVAREAESLHDVLQMHPPIPSEKSYLDAPEGWQYLLDNLEGAEEGDAAAKRHAAVLGEN